MVLQRREHRGADDRPAQGLHAAQQHHDQGVHRTRNGQDVGKHAALGEGVEAPGEAGEHPGRGEGQPLVGAHVDADGAAAQGRIPGRAQGQAEGGEQQVAKGDNPAAAKHQGQPVEDGDALGPRRRPHAEDAVVAAGEGDPLHRDGPHDLGEG